MSGFQGAGWYLVKKGEDPRWGFFLHYVRYKLEFELLTQNLTEKDRITPMSWRGLSTLIGCAYPPAADPEARATTGLLITHCKRNITICPTGLAAVY